MSQADIFAGFIRNNALNLPQWTTATRPSPASTGMTGYNTTTSNIEVYNGTSWQASSVPPSYSASFLVIAGGGGGGGAIGGGGGGAGGLVYYGAETPKTPNGAAITLTSGTAYSIVIGAGGAATSSQTGNVGSNTTVSGLSITAVGGGLGTGGASNLAGGNGGSGGGGGGTSSGGSMPGGSGTSGQGNNGGGGFHSGGLFVNGGGGGGAGAVGVSATVTNYPGVFPNGGTGLQYSINGTALHWAGGGGGGGHFTSSTAGNGGNGGGGGGGGNNNAGTGGSGLNAGASGTQSSSNANGGNAGANTGGGGGGAGGSSGGTSGAGGSGIVIISYTGAQKGTGGTVTTSGGNTIHTFTTSGTYTA